MLVSFDRFMPGINSPYVQIAAKVKVIPLATVRVSRAI